VCQYLPDDANSKGKLEALVVKLGGLITQNALADTEVIVAASPDSIRVSSAPPSLSVYTTLPPCTHNTRRFAVHVTLAAPCVPVGAGCQPHRGWHEGHLQARVARRVYAGWAAAGAGATVRCRRCVCACCDAC
jgi:hypothetical protein